MRGPRELLFFQLVVLLHRIQCHSNSFWAHRMFEISSHKVSSISSPSKAEIWTFFLQNVRGQFSIIRWPRELIFGGLVVLLVQHNASLSASGLTACYRNLQRKPQMCLQLRKSEFLSKCWFFGFSWTPCDRFRAVRAHNMGANDMYYVHSTRLTCFHGQNNFLSLTVVPQKLKISRFHIAYFVVFSVHFGFRRFPSALFLGFVWLGQPLWKAVRRFFLV